MEKRVLDVRNLSVSFSSFGETTNIVHDINFHINEAETVGIVGESGCGKSMTAMAIMQLIQRPPGVIEGEILLEGKNLLDLPEREMRKIRGNQISMIFQEPMTSLNPVLTVGHQLMEVFRIHQNMSRAQAKQAAIDVLRMVKIAMPEQRINSYPYEMSGGMRQRVMIAMALACKPKLLIADEPTTALDVTIQAQILDLIKAIQKKYDTALIMITHDLGVVANIADDIAVMYAGKIVEYGSAEDIFEHPAHPYTWGVLQSIPPEDTSDREPLHPILGSPPDLFDPPKGCPFAARCPHTMKVCNQMYPPACAREGENHYASCWLYHQKAAPVVNPITGQEVVKNG